MWKSTIYAYNYYYYRWRKFFVTFLLDYILMFTILAHSLLIMTKFFIFLCSGKNKHTLMALFNLRKTTQTLG